MENEREQIEDIMRRYGYEEDEAYAHYHLKEAQERLEKIYDRGFLSATMILPHIYALRSLLASRVLRRDYPEGWGNVSDEEEDEDDDL